MQRVWPSSYVIILQIYFSMYINLQLLFTSIINFIQTLLSVYIVNNPYAFLQKCLNKYHQRFEKYCNNLSFLSSTRFPEPLIGCALPAYDSISYWTQKHQGHLKATHRTWDHRNSQTLDKQLRRSHGANLGPLHICDCCITWSTCKTIWPFDKLLQIHFSCWVALLSLNTRVRA